MRFEGIFIVGLLLHFAVQAKADFFSPQSIYGQDSRREIYQEKNPNIVKLSRATAVQITNKTLIPAEKSAYRLKAKPVGQHYGLCSSESFVEQPAAGECSAFLVAPDILATAGHCVNSKNCSNTSWVFNFHLEGAGQVPWYVNEEDIFQCEKVLDREFTKNGQDWALVQIDRPVNGVEPVKLRRASPMNMKMKTQVFMIGYPWGLPGKISDGEIAAFSEDKSFFVTTLDSFGGNSGSAIFNATTYEVEGILVRGDDDFVKDGACKRAKRCKAFADCTGEDASDIGFIVDALDRL